MYGLIMRDRVGKEVLKGTGADIGQGGVDEIWPYLIQMSHLILLFHLKVASKKK